MTDETTNTEGGAPSVPADLAAIAAAADAELAGLEQQLPGQAAQPEPDRGAELGAMLQMGVMMAAPALPFLPQCYSDETCQRIGTAFAAVALKYGWNLEFANNPELALAAVSIPPTVQAIVLGRAFFAAKRAEAEAAHDLARRQAVAPMPMHQADSTAHAGQRL